MLLGTRPDAPTLPAASGIGMRAAVEAAVLTGLRRPPCLVSFSGGRDSSAVLAIAAEIARRHGLDPPIPAILRFPDVPESGEGEWQDLVLGHLGLSNRLVVELSDELDAVGDLATAVLRRHGVVAPANAYMHVPLLREAAGGSVLTGIGGDELLGTRAGRILLVAHRRAKPKWRDVRAAALAATPRAIRARVHRPRPQFERAWLTPAGARAVDRAVARDLAVWPQHWDAAVRHWYRTRSYAGLASTLPAIAGDHDVEIVSPFLDATVLAEASGDGGRLGFPNRTVAMRHLVGDLLPDDVLGRRTKASFSGAMWGDATRRFAEAWDGHGVDPQMVDRTALRAEWLSAVPNFTTALLLHQAWLAVHGAAGAPSS